MHIKPELHVGRGMRFVQSCQIPQGGHWKSQGVSTSKGWRCVPWYLSSNRPRHASYSFWAFFLCLQSIPGLYVLHLPLILLQWAVTYNSLFSSIFNGAYHLYIVELWTAKAHEHWHNLQGHSKTANVRRRDVRRHCRYGWRVQRPGTARAKVHKCCCNSKSKVLNIRSPTAACSVDGCRMAWDISLYARMEQSITTWAQTSVYDFPTFNSTWISNVHKIRSVSISWNTKRLDVVPNLEKLGQKADAEKWDEDDLGLL